MNESLRRYVGSEWSYQTGGGASVWRAHLTRLCKRGEVGGCPRSGQYKHYRRHNLLSINLPPSQSTLNMVLRIEEMDFDSNKISTEDVERLRQILPKDLQEPGKLTQLEIILEAIHYIKMLQNKLGTIPEY